MLQVRQLGSVGIVTDVNPYDLPNNAVSRGVNVRFSKGKIGKAPAFRRVFELVGNDTGDTLAPVDLSPAFMYDFKYPGAADRIIIVEETGEIWHYNNNAITEITDTSFVNLTPADIAFCHTTLHGVSYLTREDMLPQFLTNSASTYEPLTNWDSNHRAAIIRGFKDYLIALDITKSGTNHPTMVKWSNNAQFGAVPDSWDETDPTKNAGENVLGDSLSAWRDALPLGNALFLYNDSQVFRMVETGTNEVFAFTRKFNNRGIINTNCVVEVLGKHYVFDSTDIYIHDGVQAVSICEGSVKDYIFASIDLSAKNRFFTFFNPIQNTVHFCYRSADDLVSFTNSTKCNRAAVYDLTNQTWSFDDLPNVVGHCYANIDNILTYEDVLTSYEETGGTYAGQETGDFQFVFLCGLANTTDGLDNVLYGYDPVQGGQMPFALDATATMPAIVYRVGIDLDDQGLEITATKVLRAFYPQIEDFERDGVTLKFTGMQYNDQSPTWTTPVAFDPSTQRKTNPMVNGQYLGWYLTCAAQDDFRFSGFDADIVTTAHRG